MQDTISRKKLFGDPDFRRALTSSEINEHTVRETIILPILHELGYNNETIIRDKTLQHPFLKTGSTKRAITLVPDYVLKVEDNYAWVLEAKASNQKISSGDNVQQAYSYAFHDEIRSKYFALCNGIEFSLFRTTEKKDRPMLLFSLTDIEAHWETLCMYLSPDSFHVGGNIVYEPRHTYVTAADEFNYSTRPLLEEIPGKKQQAKRHFGVHGYFTKQTWNVVGGYIKNFTKLGDTVLDPFGGSGVTAIEALMNNRAGISTDINPMAVFIVQSLIAPVKQSELAEAFQRVKIEYQKKEPVTDDEILAALKKYSYPKGFALPKGSDVKFVEDLFSKKQLAQLALLKAIIKKEKNIHLRNSLLLMFSGLLTKANLTYHNNPNRPAAGQGNAAVFAYYRYRVAKVPVDIDLMTYFELRYKKVRDAKKEMEYYINEETIHRAKILKYSATDLNFIPKESVDYIYTDPPYGKKIPYLDLSVMWNAWLDLEVTSTDYEQEAIEGGEHHKTKTEYNDLMAQSIKEMYRVLKFDRWMSFVFAHKDPEFWHLIIDTAESCGFEYVGAVAQKNGQTSFKKRQNPFTVLSGQLIINFRKVKKPKAILRANLGMDMAQIVTQTIEGLIAKNEGATLEQINDELIIRGLELGFLDLLKKEYSDLTPLLIEDFDYDKRTEKYFIRTDTKFKTHIDVHLRIRYYLLSYLRRMERENKSPHFDEIILYILPLLKNGTTPKKETILKVLEDIAEHVGEDSWRLKKEGQRTLFD
jgi:DNA modification methylase